MTTDRSNATEQCEYDDCDADWTHVLDVQFPAGVETVRACETCTATYGDRPYVRIRRRRF